MHLFRSTTRELELEREIDRARASIPTKWEGERENLPGNLNSLLVLYSNFIGVKWKKEALDPRVGELAKSNVNAYGVLLNTYSTGALWYIWEWPPSAPTHA
jgi:hypothetical protein